MENNNNRTHNNTTTNNNTINTTRTTTTTATTTKNQTATCFRVTKQHPPNVDIAVCVCAINDSNPSMKTGNCQPNDSTQHV